VKGLPLAGNDGPVFGLGLWRHLPLELSIEAAMAALALWIYRSAAKTGSRRWVGMAVYIAALTAFLILGQAGATEAPTRGGLIASWLAVLLAMSAIAYWLDRRKQSGARTSS
jgi:quinol-cytochrome oxidoreductase complex cytochrome b subunit